MRRLGESDEALYCGLYTDAETMRFICPPLSRERAARNFRKVLARSLQPSGPKYFAMLDKASQRSIGLCAIQQPDAEMQRIEVGMMLKCEARAQGYATEALAALVTEAFLAFPIERVWVQYSPEHPAAERLTVSVGFTLCALADIREKRKANRVGIVERSFWLSNNTNNH
jgi:RimJ/RimL family protein N-acetyltransferase